MEQPNIKILTPCFGGNVTAAYFHSIVNLFPYAMQNGINLSIETLPNCSLICLGRDIMLRRAMHDDSWTHILWIDADLRFQPEYIHSMILDDKDIVGGIYPKKGLPIDFASSPEPGGEETEFLLETIYVATGFMMIKREVVEKMYDHYEEELAFKYQGDDVYVDLFAPIIADSGLYLTEDYAFCKRAKDIGFKTYMSKRFELPHYGQIEFSAEAEQEFLAEYEKSGHITINKDKPRLYFSAFGKVDPEVDPEVVPEVLTDVILEDIPDVLLEPILEDLPELPDNK